MSKFCLADGYGVYSNAVDEIIYLVRMGERILLHLPDVM